MFNRMVKIIVCAVVAAAWPAAAHARFLQTDPVGYGDNTNLYMFVANDPINNFDPNGTVCIPLVNSDSAFCRRSQLFKQLDENPKIRSRTRFFAAASTVTNALASKDIPFDNTSLSSETNNFSNNLSAKLEAFNLNQAVAIVTGKLFNNSSKEANDRAFVRAEQTIVQKALDSLRKADSHTFGKVVGEINGVLNGSDVRKTNPGFANILAKVKTELGRAIDFGNQGDRELIGNTTIEEERRACFASSAQKLRC